jgi:hypothetical protein
MTTIDPDTPDSIFPNNWISFHENGDVALSHVRRKQESRASSEILDQLEDEGFRIDNIMDYTEAEQDGIFLEGTGSLLLDRANEKHIVRSLELMKNCL